MMPTCFRVSCAALALALVVGCATTPPPERDPFAAGRANAEGGGEDIGDYDRFSTARPGAKGAARFRQTDVEDGLFENENPEQLREFLNLRCNVLGTALAKLGASDPEVVDLGYSDVAFVRDKDNARRDLLNRNNVPPAQWSGFIIPRYIEAELAKPRDQQDREWLARRGRLLIASQRFEQLSTESWERGVVEMLREGSDGREILAANMVRRLALADINFVRLAQQTLIHAVSDEAIPMLVAAAHVDLARNRGTFPKHVADTLSQIGTRAVPEILTVWNDEKGGFRRTSSDNWMVRRYLVPALGKIGDKQAVPLLIQDLQTRKFDNGDSDFLYVTVLVAALGNLRDTQAVGPVVKEWKRLLAAGDPSLNRVAREALFRISGKSFDTPDAYLK